MCWHSAHSKHNNEKQGFRFARSMSKSRLPGETLLSFAVSILLEFVSGGKKSLNTTNQQSDNTLVNVKGRFSKQGKLSHFSSGSFCSTCAYKWKWTLILQQSRHVQLLCLSKPNKLRAWFPRTGEIIRQTHLCFLWLLHNKSHHFFFPSWMLLIQKQQQHEMFN